MTKIQKVLSKLRVLPPQQQQEVLEFVESLANKRVQNGPRQSPVGLWGDLQIDITEKDIADARNEMWGGFPRGDLP